ncbi:hypothetical protein HK102_001964 [Quaeritorhiza haematococci]|nr:hypothetical protein HK102_001964 [Quaeritorhiza haematococci]
MAATAKILVQMRDHIRLWTSTNSQMSSLLDSIANVVEQRQNAVSFLPYGRDAQQQDATATNGQPSTDDPAMPTLLVEFPDLVDRLIHKQTIEIERLVFQLAERLENLAVLVKEMAALQRSALSKATEGPSKSEPVQSPVPAAQKFQFQDPVMISPQEAAAWIVETTRSYEKEYATRKEQVLSLQTSPLPGPRLLSDIKQLWSNSRNIDYAREFEIGERLRLFQAALSNR